MISAPLLARADGVQNGEQLRIGYEEFAPYSFTDEHGHAQGYSIDLIRHLAAPHGYEVVFVATSNPAEMLTLLARGDIDVTSLLAVTPERKRLGSYTLPLGSFQTSLFVLEDSALQAPAELASRRIGAVAGSFAVTAAETVAFAEIVELETQNSLLMPLLTGSVDAVAAATEPFLAGLRRIDLEGRVRMIEPPLLEKPRGFIVRSDLPRILADLNDSIGTDLAQAEMSALHQRWFGKTKTFADDPRFRWYLFSGLAALAILMIALGTALAMRREAERTFAASATNRLLVDALNGVDLSVVIYDEKLEAVHWNDAVIRNFPKMVPHLRRGETMEELIRKSYLDGTTKTTDDDKEVEAFARRIVDDVRLGEDVTRDLYAEDGRVYEATEFPVGEKMYASVRKDITRIEAQAAEIRDQKDELLIANEKLKNFSFIAAHDLQTPLRHQSIFLDYIERDLGDAGVNLPTEVIESIAGAKNGLGRMNSLVDDLLSYAQAGRQAGDEEVLKPSERIENIVALTSVPEGFQIEIAPALPAVRVSTAGFDIVVRNLLGNAIKHHDRDGGLIQLRGYSAEGQIVFEVEDDGPGIPEKHRERIFEPFNRLKLKSNVAGNGLGLSFAKQTVESWGGTLSVHDPKDRGSVFRFTIPDHLGRNVNRLGTG